LRRYLYRVTNMDQVSVFNRQIPSFPSNICWGCLFSIVCFWHLCQKLSGLSCMNSYLSLLFCFTGLHVCFCASTMLFLLLRLCLHMTKVHYIHLWKCHNETHYIVQLIYANKFLKRNIILWLTDCCSKPSFVCHQREEWE
jgi:hypothetical protein